MDFPGTINSHFEHFMHQVLDITKSLAYHGFKKIILLNGHGSNLPNLDLVARRTNLETDAECLPIQWTNLLTVDKEFLPSWRESKFPGGCAHACELETSLYLYLDADNVRKDKIANGTISFNEENSPFNWVDCFAAGPATVHLVDGSYSETGVLGEPELATVEKGRARLRGGGAHSWSASSTYFKDRPKDVRRDRHRRPPTMPMPWGQLSGQRRTTRRRHERHRPERYPGRGHLRRPRRLRRPALPARRARRLRHGRRQRDRRRDRKGPRPGGGARRRGRPRRRRRGEDGRDDRATGRPGDARCHCDVVRRASVDDLARTLVDELGRVDILVNSAGTAFRCPAEDFPEERLDAILALNIKGTYLPCQAIGRHMLAQGSGSIVNLASIGGFAAFPHASAYVASKGGVVQLTRVLAVEWTARGVRVNGIAPSRCDSPLTRTLATQSSVTSDFIDGRMLTDTLLLPRDLVGTAVFLASEASGRVSGHIVAVDDGYLAA